MKFFDQVKCVECLLCCQLNRKIGYKNQYFVVSSVFILSNRHENKLFSHRIGENSNICCHPHQ